MLINIIPFNIPTYLGKELKYLKQVIKNRKLSGDGAFTKKCHKWMENNLHCKKALLTTSGTHALEMAAILIDIKPGDEVIMPSYTFVSTANAFVLRGAKIIFIDIRPDTANLDETKIAGAISEKTKAIVVVHYAGVSCDMDIILKIAKKNNLIVIEDAAQGLMSKYKDKYLGTIGDIGCLSFHETKNYTCGEGGALLINNKKFIERAEIIREKGTNRTKFYRGQIDKYTWVDIGSSYLPSEFNAAYLYAQIESADKINCNRIKAWNIYYKKLLKLSKEGYFELPIIPGNCQHNGHMFYIKTRNLLERTKLLNFFKQKNIFSVFHYIPLHNTAMGCKNGKFYKKDVFTTLISERIVRLPLYYDIKKRDLLKIINIIKKFYLNNNEK